MTIEHRRGDRVTWILTVRDAAGNAYPITGCPIRFSIKWHFDDSDENALVFKATADVQGGGNEQILIHDGANGKAKIFLVEVDTKDMEVADYECDAQITFADPVGVKTVLVDTYKITKDVTRAY
jgi:hypothetical protein